MAKIYIKISFYFEVANYFFCLKDWLTIHYIFFLPKAIFGLRVLSLPASVCVCVYVCFCVNLCQSLACPRDNSRPVHARINKFEKKVQNNLVKVPIVLWSDPHWPSMSHVIYCSKFTPIWACELVRAISHHQLKSKFDQKSILSLFC